MQKVLPGVINLAIEAGKEILKVYHTDFTVEYKKDESPLTEADKRSQDIIAAGLNKISSYPVLSEEMEQPAYAKRKNWNAFWLVDPLDGTREFIKRNGEFTVNIALIKDNTPILGVIYLPVLNIIYYAIKGRGAFREDGTNHRRQKLPLHKPVSSVFTIVASRSRLSPGMEEFLRKEKIRRGDVRTVYAGSSIKFCRVAEGAADAYPRFAPTMEWDTAAGQVIAEESGKKVVLTDGITPLSYNKESLINPEFVVL